MSQVDNYRLQGNELYNKNEFSAALEAYNKGLVIEPKNAVLHANKAMVFLKMQKYENAEEACTKCLECDPKYIKAFSRRATARVQLGKPELAKSDLEQVLKLEPDNKQAAGELKKLLKQFKDQVSSTTSATPTKSEPVKNAEKVPKSKELQKSETVAETTEKKPTKSSVTLGKELPIAKDAYTQVKQTIKPLPIQPVVNKAMEIINTKSGEKSIKVPTTSSELEHLWREYQKDPASLLEMMKSIPASSYVQMFSNVLSEEMLSILFQVFENNVKNNISVLNSLVNLAKVKRFDVAFMFCSTSDRNKIHSILKEAEVKEAQAIATQLTTWKETCKKFEYNN